jgi:CheY-like chemotaxis protein
MDQERPDVVFLDLTMPVLDGPMTLEAMQRSSLRTVPVVLMSGTWGGQSRPVGAAAILDKPFESKTILKLIRRLAPPVAR